MFQLISTAIRRHHSLIQRLFASSEPARNRGTELIPVIAAVVWLACSGSSAQAQLQEAKARTCNLIGNAAFEGVTQSPAEIHQWALTVNSGAGSLAILTVPQPVQSGAHAARVTVTQPGDLYLSVDTGTDPGIIVRGSTEYRLSVRLHNDSGQQARLSVTEWDAFGGVSAVRVLEDGGGSGIWTTLEGTFTTESTTRYVSPRLLHSLEAGVFDWDDPMLSRVRTGKACIDLRHHRGQTMPGFKLCGPWLNVGGILKRWCHDAEKSASNELLRSTALFVQPDTFETGNFDMISHNGTNDTRLGVHKNIDILAGSRCFANPGTLCGPTSGANANFPPQTVRMISDLPVIDLGIVPPTTYNQGSVTAGAKLEHGWKEFDVLAFDPQTGTQGPFIGSIKHRQWMFVAARVDFGGDLGVQENVLVIEEEAVGGALDPTNFGGGKNLERYWFVRGYGQASQTLWTDTDCAANPSQLTCNGNYDVNAVALLTFENFGTNDMDFSSLPPIAPFNIVDWWLR